MISQLYFVVMLFMIAYVINMLIVVDTFFNIVCVCLVILPAGHVEVRPGIQDEWPCQGDWSEGQHGGI